MKFRITCFLFIISFPFLPIRAVLINGDSQTGMPEKRKLLLEKCKEKDWNAVRAILQDSETSFFRCSELVLINYCLADYDAVLKLAKETTKDINTCNTCPGQDKELEYVLVSFLTENYEQYLSGINRSGLSDGKKELLKRILQDIIREKWNDQQEFSRLTANAINRFSEEKHAEKKDFIQAYSSKWRWGLGGDMGYSFVSGNLSDYLSVKAGFLLSVNAYYRNLYFSIPIYYTLSTLKKDITSNTVSTKWEKGEIAGVSGLGLVAGYSLTGYRFRVTPFIGPAFSNCSPTAKAIQNNEDLDDLGIKRGFSYMYGLKADFRLSDPARSKSYYLYSLHFRIQYIPNTFNNVNRRYAGNILSLTLGLTMDYRN